MTNEQLRVMLAVMLNELKDALERARVLMPEDAPRPRFKNLFTNQEYDGEFEALWPLVEVINNWTEALEHLDGSKQATE